MSTTQKTTATVERLLKPDLSHRLLTFFRMAHTDETNVLEAPGHKKTD